MNACSALAHKAGTVGKPHCSDLFCLKWHRYTGICFGAKYGLVFFYTAVKLPQEVMDSQTSGWNKSPLRLLNTKM